MPIRATKRGAQRTPLGGEWDVLVCGASFAGLAVCRELSGAGARVLMVDRYEVGERQTSACAAPTEWLRALGLEESIRQTFGDLVIHTPRRPFPWHLPFTFSTFDYPQLCALLRAQAPDVAFETAKIDGRCGHVVHTDRGSLSAPLIVDRLGWGGGRAVAAADRRRPRLAAGAVDRRRPHPAAGGAAVARPGGPPAVHRTRSRIVAGPALPSRGVLVELPGRRRAPRRRRLLRPARPRQGADGSPGRRPRAARRALSGQLDPPPDALPRRGLRPLRRRQRRALPADDGGGHPHRALLRAVVRARAARGAGRAPDPRAGAGALRGVLRRAPPRPSTGCCASRTSSASSTRARR